MLAETTAARVRLALDLGFVVVSVVAQQFFGMVERVSTWLPVVEVRWWPPQPSAKSLTSVVWVFAQGVQW
jgi:hypothetical protein